MMNATLSFTNGLRQIQAVTSLTIFQSVRTCLQRKKVCSAVSPKLLSQWTQSGMTTMHAMKATPLRGKGQRVPSKLSGERNLWFIKMARFWHPTPLGMNLLQQ